MISLIIIGKNIEHTIDKCILSTITCAQKLNCLFEVIYIDSASTDSSFEIAKRNSLVKSFQIYEGQANAAIARNFGVEVSKYENLVFIDGDMELCFDFLRKIFVNGTLQYRFVSGDLINIFYDENWKPLNVKTPYFRKPLLRERIEYVTGGFFVITRTLWNAVGGMSPELRRCQDLDLGLRLAKIGTPLIRIPKLFAYHHTISYYNKERFKKMVFNGNYFYPGVLIRRHFLNRYAWPIFLRSYSSTYLLIITLVAGIFNPWLLLVYIIFIGARATFKRDKQQKTVFQHFFAYIIMDFFIIGGSFLFYPKIRSSPKLK